MQAAALRLDELGSVQFAQLCRELLEPGAAPGAEVTPWGFSALSRAGSTAPGGARLAAPTLVLSVWLRAPETLQRIVDDAVAASPARPASVLLLTNVSARVQAGGAELATVGPQELWELVRARPALRVRLPFLLGIADASLLLPEEARARSSGDVAAAVELARVFVPTQAYARALAVLERHGFVVLSGPPEVGKTAIARTLGLAALSDGWELHECVRPDELRQRFAPERRQLFVADDAFGSTEYRPETAERWALELDRVLRMLDGRHRLIWTSRPTPLHAALRRIHREHGVERFPQPAQVGVRADELEAAEKALILFRHTKAVSADDGRHELVRRHGWEIVSHPHFTPERIRRFCANRLGQLAAAGEGADVADAVAAEIREPTAAMAASYHALGQAERAVLHALVDTPPGPAGERELAAALRRHAPAGSAPPLAELADRLADHVLHRVENGAVSWVHPSWRDLVIEELARDGEARRAFLRGCGVHGVALALSTAGGSSGDRALPLLREDADWDALAERLSALLPTLAPPEVALVLHTLVEAVAHAPEAARAELDALAREGLVEIGHLWESASTAAPVGLLAAWLSLAASLPEPPACPERALAAAWIELLPGTGADAAALDDWLALTELAAAHAPGLLGRLGFPHGQLGALREAVQSARAERDPEQRARLARILVRIGSLVPALADEARAAAWVLGQPEIPLQQTEPEPPLRALSPELELLLDQPLGTRRRDEAIVARVLRDL